MSADLAAFLLARIAEDEAAAQAAAQEADRLDDAFEVEDPKWRVWSRPFASVTSTGPVAEFVDRQTPARVLAECEAKRQIVAEHGPETVDESWGKTVTYCKLCRYDDGLDRDIYPCRTLSLLALPYVDHLDFDPAWRWY